MKQDVLFELGCEELPSAMVATLGQALFDAVTLKLNAAGLEYGPSRWFATPRRLAFVISELPSTLPLQIKVKRGPKQEAAFTAQGEPTPALLGFARSCGVDYRELQLHSNEKAETHYEYRSEAAGQLLSTFMVSCLTEVLQSLPIPKPMRWGNGEFSFARPVHWLVLMQGHDVIDASFFGIRTGRLSYGHRFMHPQAIEIKDPKSYEAQLQAAFVLADFTKRRLDIVAQIEAMAAKQQWTIPFPSALLQEITSIVEWPSVIAGDYSQVFLSVPASVLIAAMQQHQKCLPVYDKSQKLLPHFIAVSNLLSKDEQAIIKGNQKVMHARLSDAMFFYEQDRKQPLIQYAPLCEKVIFEQRLGSLSDKNQRVLSLALELGVHFGVAENLLRRAITLSKCDLMTAMVAEFPELQGEIGEFYARADGEAEEIAAAMFEQYLPRFAGDILPRTTIGYILSLAERLDTLMGIFAIGQKPSGEKDPYKLRRHALAVVRLLLARPNRLELGKLLALAQSSYGFLTISSDTMHDLEQFIAERLQSYVVQQGYSLEAYYPCFSRQSQCYYDFWLRMKSFAKLRESEQIGVLVQVSKRVKQILTANTQTPAPLNPDLLQAPQEQALWQFMQALNDGLLQALSQQDYDTALQLLAGLAQPLSDFFEHVFVMVEDESLRRNRLSLLSGLQAMLDTVVMFGK